MITVYSLEEWRHLCPYGIWTCDGRREVLFNRLYWPILERDGPDKIARPAHPAEWVSWKKQDYFFDDGSSPWRKGKAGKEALKRINQTLIAWKLPALDNPPRRATWRDAGGSVHPQHRKNPWDQRLEAAL